MEKANKKCIFSELLTHWTGWMINYELGKQKMTGFRTIHL